MRVATLAALLALPAASLADRQIFIPTGDKIPYRAVRLEYLHDGGSWRDYQAFAGFGITKSLETELIMERFSPNATIGSFSLAYNFFNPITDTLPGISIGIQDALNKTQFGRMAYAAVTFRSGVDAGGLGEHLDLTLGLGVGRKVAPFVGVMLPFSDRFHGLVEHDGTRVTAGFELLPLKDFAFRAAAQEGRAIFSARWMYRF